jgi:Na+-translocating ferredoxin:NAD+ oxidoreductase RnfG subunit
MKRCSWLAGGAGLAAFAAPVACVFAADYQSAEQVQRTLFPQALEFESVPLTLNAQQQSAIITLAGVQPRHGSLRVYRAMRGSQLLGHVFIDEVIGRQDLITYAVGIDASGKLTPVEILAYRESHGGEIRTPKWRAQFAGRDDLAHLRFQSDIKNIAGATLSSQHVTQGVRWLLSLWQTTLRSAT